MPFSIRLITPERTLTDEEVTAISLPTTEGEITVLQHHVPLTALLVPGIIKIHPSVDKKTIEEIAVSGGFIHVQEDGKVLVLADTAERGHELSLSVIEEAKKRAREVMQQAARQDDVAFTAAAAALEHELARYKVARAHHHTKHAPPVDTANLPHDENPV